MSKPWPPPPDLESIQELVRSADPEGHLAEGAPSDEYEPEEEEIFAAIGHLCTAQLTAKTLQPILEEIWRNSFNLKEIEMANRVLALNLLAQQIERFFGPEAKPQVR
jgi:hypothetical protein